MRAQRDPINPRVNAIVLVAITVMYMMILMVVTIMKMAVMIMLGNCFES